MRNQEDMLENYSRIMLLTDAYQSEDAMDA